MVGQTLAGKASHSRAAVHSEVRMDTLQHTLADLFEQLGLPEAPEEIGNFIASGRPLPDEIALHAAHFWSPAQSAFLFENLLSDADWALAIDQLNIALREPRDHLGRTHQQAE
jgi:hypothetical protein